MDKQDLTQYGEQELSLHVLNTECLYRGFMRCDDEQDLRNLVEPLFIFTSEQFDELLDDLENRES